MSEMVTGRGVADGDGIPIAKVHGIINIYAHGTVRQILAQNWVEW